jgi:hypothetical protein
LNWINFSYGSNYYRSCNIGNSFISQEWFKQKKTLIKP